MSYRYELNCGQYVLMRDGSPIGPCLDEVCLALDAVEGTLHKHGSPGKVQAWLSQTQAGLRAGGCTEMADNLVSISGRFPLALLNRCLDTAGFAGVLYRKALSGELGQQEIAPPAQKRRPSP